MQLVQKVGNQNQRKEGNALSNNKSSKQCIQITFLFINLGVCINII